MVKIRNSMGVHNSKGIKVPWGSYRTRAKSSTSSKIYHRLRAVLSVLCALTIGWVVLLETVRPKEFPGKFNSRRMVTNLIIFFIGMSIKPNLLSNARFFTLEVAPFDHVIEMMLGVVILDLFSYLRHRLYHRVPLLWRFHAIHHSAEDMDWLDKTDPQKRQR